MSKEKVEEITEEVETVEQTDLETEELLVKEIKELKDRLLREQAENVNYRRRNKEELEMFKKFANESLITEIIGTIDDLERAIKMDDNDLTDDLSKMLEGFKMVYSNLMLKLEKFGVKMINPIKEDFDPEKHQAILAEEVDNMKPDMVIEVLQKGYMLHDKVIRPAMVKVSK